MNLCAADAKTVTFKVKDYRIDGPGRYKTMMLDDQPAVRDRHARRKRALSNTIDPMVPVIARAKPGEQAAAARQIPSRPRPNHAKRNGRGELGRHQPTDRGAGRQLLEDLISVAVASSRAPSIGCSGSARMPENEKADPRVRLSRLSVSRHQPSAVVTHGLVVLYCGRISVSLPRGCRPGGADVHGGNVTHAFIPLDDALGLV